MWEFCLTVQNNSEIKNYIQNKLKEYSQEFDIVVTVLNKQNIFDILIACNEYEKYRMILYLQDVISECICYYYKNDFLQNNLRLKIKDGVIKQAFLSALLFFDKDTDKYIVNKYLNIDKKLNIDGFFNFKLATLRKKWAELIEITNDNEIYLYSDETFIELIKFLIDNLEIKNDVINIMPSQNSYDLFDSKFDKISLDKSDMNEEKLVNDLIALSPKNINIYCTEQLSSNIRDLICRLFEKRVKFLSTNY